METKTQFVTENMYRHRKYPFNNTSPQLREILRVELVNDLFRDEIEEYTASWLTKQHTKNLLNRLRYLQKDGLIRIPLGHYSIVLSKDVLMKALSQREHVPNKRENKKRRQRESKQFRNSRNQRKTVRRR